MKLNLSFRNMGAVVANFRAADAVLQTEVRVAVTDAGEFCRELAYFLSPVDTGFMREHLKTLYSDDGLVFETGWLEEDFLVAGLAFYPIYVEFGTRYMAAQPSLSPAYQDTKVDFKRRISAAVRASFARAARTAA